MGNKAAKVLEQELLGLLDNGLQLFSRHGRRVLDGRGGSVGRRLCGGGSSSRSRRGCSRAVWLIALFLRLLRDPATARPGLGAAAGRRRGRGCARAASSSRALAGRLVRRRRLGRRGLNGRCVAIRGRGGLVACRRLGLTGGHAGQLAQRIHHALPPEIRVENVWQLGHQHVGHLEGKEGHDKYENVMLQGGCAGCLGYRARNLPKGRRRPPCSRPTL